MTVNDIIKAHQCCFRVGESGCPDCPLYEMESKEDNCQKVLMLLTIDKLKELVELLDDKTNHHYYDTLEFYQEENTQLWGKLDSILEIIEKTSK